MNVEMIQTLFDYHYARHGQMWGSIMQLSERDFISEGAYSHGSLRNQLVHLIDDDMSWVSFLESKAYTHLQAEDFETRDRLFEIFEQTEAYVLEFVNKLDDAILQKSYHWQPSAVPHPQEITGLQVLVHVVNHGTDHRAQIMRMLQDFGVPTFDQDLMAYLWQSGKTKAT
ncbi:MAG: DinB family protein [Chloroflexota bacterium]